MARPSIQPGSSAGLRGCCQEHAPPQLEPSLRGFESVQKRGKGLFCWLPAFRILSEIGISAPG
jgi:hypothetical protein